MIALINTVTLALSAAQQHHQLNQWCEFEAILFVSFNQWDI